MDSSAYLIANEHQEVQAVRSIVHDAMEHWWEEDKRVQLSFRKVRLAWFGQCLTFLPTRLYNGDQRREYLASLTDLDESMTVLADPIPELDSFLVYAIEQERLNRWRRQFIGCRFYHVLTPILHQLSRLSHRQVRPALYAYIRNEHLLIAGLERNQLLFCNVFSCRAAKDFLYFTLLAYEQCGWKSDQVPLRLFGEIVADSEIYRLLYRYVREISFLEAPQEELRFGSRAKEQSGHLFFDLSSLHLYH